MGLLPGDTNSDAKYNIHKESKPKSDKQSSDPKNWIKTVLTKNANKTNESPEEEKIDTNGLLKKEDKNDL